MRLLRWAGQTSGSEGARSGTDLLRTVRRREITAQTSALALTAYAIDRDAESLLNAGFDGYLAKPFIRDDLQGTLNQLFGSR